MLTPIDIQSKNFTKSTFGYNKTEVEEFVGEVALEYERLYKENLEFKDRISVLNDALKNYKALEDSLQNTLMFAQSTAEDVKNNAKEKAEVTIMEAKAKAEELIREADSKVFEAERKVNELKNQFNIYKTQMESVIEAQRKLLEDLK